MTPWHYRDGTDVYLAETDENPDDLFTTDKFAKPAGLPGSVDEQSPRDQG